MTVNRRIFLKGVLVATMLPVRPVNARVLLGINLRPRGDTILKQVESACAKPLDIQFQDMESRGINKFLMDGTPFVRINPNYGSILEELIVHELSHLKLALQGFPRYDWFFDNAVPKERYDEQIQFPNWLGIHVLSPLEHCIFYPQLKKSGYHPASWRIEEMDSIIAQRSYGPNLNSPLETGARYCQTALELGDSATLHKMDDWYKAVGWTDGLELGKRAFAEVRGISNWTPTTALSAFVSISNVLIQPLSWKLISHGTATKSKGRVKESYGQIHLKYG